MVVLAQDHSRASGNVGRGKKGDYAERIVNSYFAVYCTTYFAKAMKVRKAMKDKKKSRIDN